MKKIAKIITFVVSLALCLSIPATAFADMTVNNNYSFSLLDAENKALYKEVLNDNANAIIKQAYQNNKSIMIFYNTADSKYYLFYYYYNSSYDIFYGGAGLSNISGQNCAAYTWSKHDDELTQVTDWTSESRFGWFSGYIFLAYSPAIHRNDTSYMTVYQWKYSGDQTYKHDNLQFYYTMSAAGLDEKWTDEGSSSGGSSGGSGTTVDLTGTNNILKQIQATVTSIETYCASLKSTVAQGFENVISAISSGVANLSGTITGTGNYIVTSVNDNFTNLKTYLDDKYDRLYNCIMYGNQEGDDSQVKEYENKMGQTITDINGFNGDINAAAGYVESSGAEVADNITAFTTVYNGMTTVFTGLGAIITFALVVYFVLKVVGR